ncbi:CMGC/CDK protein kinase [Plasmodium falciparum 7G8]|uniref:Cyclin-dependent kinase 2 homolog n=1 Tax=Plasmodium falciparum (isolate 7G8) TaxID=57266 RepID=W7F6U7_PLAF8|nr:CMGC/CDK protein kinase [Plasmodium falciparum 7G8]
MEYIIKITDTKNINKRKSDQINIFPEKNKRDNRINEEKYTIKEHLIYEDEQNISYESNKDSSSEENTILNEYSSDEEKNKIDCILNGCRNVKNYKKLNKISEGTYGAVYRAQNKRTKKIVALKKLKNFSSMHNEGFAMTSLREINILLQLQHDNILSIKEVVFGKHLNDIYLVMEYIEHELKMILDNKSPSFTISELKCLLKQLLSGINYLHRNWVMHRDLKPTNLLYSNKGILKICDFGMARKFGHVTNHNFTKNVVTLWYRAPELLLGEQCYTNKIDIWSAGCIFAEMILKKPLFVGENEIDQLFKILCLLGLPDKESYPEFYEYSFISKNKELFKKKKIKMNVNNIRSHFPNIANQFSGLYLSDNGLDLLQKMLHYNPQCRISAQEALNHPYFNEFPKPLDIKDMPIVPDSNKFIRSNKMANHFKLNSQNNIQFHS